MSLSVNFMNPVIKKCLRMEHKDNPPMVLNRYPSGCYILPEHRINLTKFCFRNQTTAFLHGIFEKTFYVFTVSFTFYNRALNTPSDFIISMIQYSIHTCILYYWLYAVISWAGHWYGTCNNIHIHVVTGNGKIYYCNQQGVFPLENGEICSHFY